jgi:hypothetical protein
MSAFTDIPARRIRIRENDPVFFMSRVLMTTGVYLTNAAMSGGTFTYALFDLLAVNPRAAVSTGSLSPISNYLTDTLNNTDPRWTEDQLGFNFSWLAPGSLFLLTSDLADTGGDGEFRMEILATPASGPPFFIGPYQVSVAEMLTES